MEITRTLAKSIIAVDYRTLSRKAIEATKRLVLDSLACAVGGSSMVEMKSLNDLVKEWDGKKESTVVAFGSRVPSPSAALVNGSMGRALDFDDCYDKAPIHSAVPVVSAGFAVAERRGAVSGKEFITAVTLGIDLSCRMSAATPLEGLEGYGWTYSAIYGYFGAAATSAKILGLSEDKLLNALGIAYHQASGTRSGNAQGRTTKAMGSGFAARGGVVSALMAERGLTGSNECMAGKWGIYNLFHRGECITERLTDGLGKTFMGEDDSLKPYPCCRCIHPFIDAALTLVKENNIRPEDVERVTAYAGEKTYIGECEPLELKQNPPNSVAAQFSIPWVLAIAITYRKVEIKDFTEQALRNKDIHRLARKVITRKDPELNQPAIEPAVVEINMKDGRVYRERVSHARGSPENPLTTKDVAEKFRNCASYAARPIPKKKLGQTVQMVEGLDDVTDVGQIIRLLG